MLMHRSQKDRLKGNTYSQQASGPFCLKRPILKQSERANDEELANSDHNKLQSGHPKAAPRSRKL